MKKILLMLCLCVTLCIFLSACPGTTTEHGPDGEITTDALEGSGDQTTAPDETEPGDQTGDVEDTTVPPEDDSSEESTDETEKSTDEPEESTNETETEEKNYELPGIQL